ncbi:TonB family protein [Paraglaciecola sp.]|uniref:TonB family protein n=1 Tax=Paraglaciecola sp. TaxID=1920173 RepID=UPI003EF92247
MQNQLVLNNETQNLASILLSIIPAAGITFALFAGMQNLIANKSISNKQAKPAPVISIVYQEQDTPVITRTTLKPKPEPLKLPLVKPQLIKEEPNKDWDPSLLTQTMPIPKIKTNLNNKYVAPGGDARPIVRIPPKYPLDAAKEGIEGWVKLSFSVSNSGTVENIQILDAQPKRIFNKSAKRALAKWKYKPNIANGVSQSQDNLTVMLEFKINA